MLDRPRLLRVFACLLAALLFLRPAVPALTAQTTAADRFAAFDQAVADELNDTRTPGALVALVEGDRIVHALAYGVANVETNQPMRRDMVFPIASMTKMYTATTLLSLAEQGKIDVGASIGRYLDGLPPRLSAVTIHQILSHTAGFRDDAGITNRSYDDGTIEQQVRAYDDNIFFTEPGEVFSYANQGFNIAGLIVQKAGGKPYSQMVQELVLTPLGMKHSTYRLPIVMTYPFSQTHGGPAGGPPQVQRPMGVSAPWPVGGLFSSLDDLSRFAVAFMHDGAIDGKEAVPAAVFRRMAAPNVPVHSQIDGGRYGYGLITYEDRGVRFVEHGGTLGGSATDFVMVPDRKLAVIVFANRTSHLTRTVEGALDVLLGRGPAARTSALPLKPEEAGEYVGRYSQGAGGAQEIVRTEAGIGMRSGQTVLPLTRIGRDAFTVVFPGFTDPIRVEFVRGSEGAIVYLHSRLRAFKRMP